MTICKFSSYGNRQGSVLFVDVFFPYMLVCMSEPRCFVAKLRIPVYGYPIATNGNTTIYKRPQLRSTSEINHATPHHTTPRHATPHTSRRSAGRPSTTTLTTKGHAAGVWTFTAGFICCRQQCNILFIYCFMYVHPWAPWREQKGRLLHGSGHMLNLPIESEHFCTCKYF